ncbi:hypothetical protein [Succiniclasticum ruminis]|uniref:Uncharacterized protein n=1 Tax=Succiniclasticum ruminis DSM 9236 TaxID=1123323 RepID=A0A1I2E9N5_9FIRM|nr:hypothetical protein [Succiniclasticum ruminis]SFE89403.1 hypothetical protein SAMN05216245_13114 [Succiniclasticum ruminis DSM 9236]
MQGDVKSLPACKYLSRLRIPQKPSIGPQSGHLATRGMPFYHEGFHKKVSHDLQPLYVYYNKTKPSFRAAYF